MRVLCETLKRNTTLIALNIMENCIGRTRTQMLSDALKVNKTLKKLYIAGIQ